MLSHRGAHVPARAVYLEAAELQALGRGGGDHGAGSAPAGGTGPAAGPAAPGAWS